MKQNKKNSILKDLEKKGLLTDKSKDTLRSIDEKLLKKEVEELNDIKSKFDLFIFG